MYIIKWIIHNAFYANDSGVKACHAAHAHALAKYLLASLA